MLIHLTWILICNMHYCKNWFSLSALPEVRNLRIVLPAMGSKLQLHRNLRCRHRTMTGVLIYPRIFPLLVGRPGKKKGLLCSPSSDQCCSKPTPSKKAWKSEPPTLSMGSTETSSWVNRVGWTHSGTQLVYRTVWPEVAATGAFGRLELQA